MKKLREATERYFDVEEIDEDYKMKDYTGAKSKTPKPVKAKLPDNDLDTKPSKGKMKPKKAKMPAVDLVKKESEELDEVSRKTLNSYISKAHPDAQMQSSVRNLAKRSADANRKKGDHEAAKDFDDIAIDANRKVQKRLKGLNLASRKELDKKVQGIKEDNVDHIKAAEEYKEKSEHHHELKDLHNSIKNDVHNILSKVFHAALANHHEKEEKRSQDLRTHHALELAKSSPEFQKRIKDMGLKDFGVGHFGTDVPKYRVTSEDEQLDEISKKLAGNYIVKARDSIQDLDANCNDITDPDYDKKDAKSRSRYGYEQLAYTKLLARKGIFNGKKTIPAKGKPSEKTKQMTKEDAEYSKDSRPLIGYQIHSKSGEIKNKGKVYANTPQGRSKAHRTIDKYDNEYGSYHHNLKPVYEDEIFEDDARLSISLLIKMLEYAREEAKTDIDLHKATERMVALLDKKDSLDINDYKAIIKECYELDEVSKEKLAILFEKANNQTDSDTLRKKAKWHKERFGSKMNGASLAKAGRNEYRAELQDKGFKFKDFDDMREDEQLDEISKEKAADYLEKVPASLEKSKNSDKSEKQKRKILLNRKDGSLRAIKVLAKEDEVIDSKLSLFKKLAATKDHSPEMEQHKAQVTRDIIRRQIGIDDAKKRLKEDQMSSVDSKSAVSSNVRQKKLRQGGVTKMTGVAPANKPGKSLGSSSGTGGLDATNGNSQSAGIQK